MGLISFLVFQCRTAFDVDHGLPRDLKHLTLSDVDNLEIANYSNLTTVFYPLGNFRQALCIRSCHEDLVLTRKSHNCPHNCAGIAFIQGDSAGGSKLIEQTLHISTYFLQSVYVRSVSDTLLKNLPINDKYKC